MADESREGKSRVLVVGGTGYIGSKIVAASLAAGHPTYVLQRPEICLNIEKVQMLLSFKASGARLLEASLCDHAALVDAVRHVDVVVSAISGVHIRSHHILMQLKLVDAMKDAGNVKRFIPSEFGIDPARMENALQPGRVTFDDKMKVRKAVEAAGIPFTYISAGCFAAYFVGGLCDPRRLLPSRDVIRLHGDGNVKATFADEDDIAKYTIMTMEDPRALNKSIYIRPPENILSQLEMVTLWELLLGKKLQKICVPEHDFLDAIKDSDYSTQVGLGHYHQVFYGGCLTNFDIGDHQEASKLYPNIGYVRVKDYLKRYL